jgi:hypothetical protein
LISWRKCNAFFLGIRHFYRFLCSANAAARVHHARSRHAIVRPSQAVIPGYAIPGGVQRDDSVPGGFRTTHDDPPSYNDPSKFGGG